jgi:chromate transporter
VSEAHPVSVVETFRVGLRLGLTSFGGPIAHIGYFRREYVEHRRWLDETRFAELVTLCQVLPGPASSQLGIAIGTLRAGKLGGVAAWLGFTLPSAIALTAFALLTSGLDVGNSGWVAGLKLAAVAIVAQAVWSMARTLAPDVPRILMAIAAAAVLLLAPSAVVQVAVILVGGALGWLLLRGDGVEVGDGAAVAAVAPTTRSSERLGTWALLGLFVALLVILPVIHGLVADRAIALVDVFYRTGALVFGGGHVVLPLLHSAVVDPGWISDDRFLAGYGAAQAVPGPLFTFAAFLGADFEEPPNGIVGAMLALTAIFLPSFLLIWGALPHWDRLRGSAGVAAALRGTNAVVVGILGAALVTPVGTGAIHSPAEFLLALTGFAALMTGRVPPIVVVAISAVISQVTGFR